jgi:proline dehydrogenase
MVRRSFLFRGLVRRFIAGDTLEEALKVAERMVSEGYLTSLDYLGENTSSPEAAQQAKATYIAMLEQIAKSPCAPNTNISIKLTQCGLDIGKDYAQKVLAEVLDAAERLGSFVRVDMEGSDYTGVTVDILAETWKTHKNVGTVLQTYLYRTADDLERLVGLGMRLRLVKGAYLEPASVAYPHKADVDRSYVELSKKLLSSGIYHGIATHDEKIIAVLKEYVRDQGIDKSTFEFQMIYGVRRSLQEQLKAEGYNMRIYIPYGDQWYPYFTRRLAERPANVFFILKSLFKG